jgi:hypothetical protein
MIGISSAPVRGLYLLGRDLFHTSKAVVKCRRDRLATNLFRACPDGASRSSDAFSPRFHVCLKFCPETSSDITNRRSGR